MRSVVDFSDDFTAGNESPTKQELRLIARNTHDADKRHVTPSFRRHKCIISCKPFSLGRASELGNNNSRVCRLARAQKLGSNVSETNPNGVKNKQQTRC